MPGVFEPCTAGPSGWLRYLASQTPLSRSIGSLAKLLGDGSVWILVTSGIIEQLSPELEPTWFPSLCPSYDKFASDWSIPRTPGSVLLPTIRPASKPTYDWSMPNRLSIQRTMYGVTDSCTLKRLASTVPVRQQVSGVLLLAPPLDDEIDLATHRASQGHAPVMRRSVTESLLLVTMLYFVMPNFCLEMLNTHTLPFSIY